MSDLMRVLVVDDERPIREGCHRVLTAKNYDVTTAENGHAALEILEREAVDLILLDLKMPVLSGEEVLQAVQEHYSDIPVIIITGHGTVDTAVECMKNGAYDFITKPFQIDQFLATVNRASEKRKLEQQARLYQEENVRNLYDLHLEKSRLLTMINCMANGVMVTNRNMEVVLHNPVLMQLLDIKDKLDTPVPILKITDDDALIKTLEGILGQGAGKSESISQEIQVGARVLRAISAPALGPERQILGTVTVLEDITPFKQLDQMKTDFVNMVAHELRSPLVSIRQLQSVIIEGLTGPLNEKQKDYLSRGMSKIDALLSLINDLLDIAKIEAGTYVQHRVPTDVGKLIQETVDLMAPRAEQQGITISCEYHDLRQVQADPKNMEKVLNNLLSNAINYSPNGGSVAIRARGLGEFVEIQVKDTGVGIPEAELPKIFDKFYRVKHPETRKVIGTGLGLAIVKSVVEAHNGTIEVHSTLGRGSTFTIRLPMIAL
jgi:two-component system, OmpR family, phosphate regulon sensor histidine kinase PhoR